MKTLSTKNILIVLIVLSAAAVAGYGFMLWSVVEQTNRVALFIDELSYEVDREAQLRSLGALIEDITEDRMLIDQQFISEGEDAVVAYITMLESLPQHVPVSVEIGSVSTDGVAEDGTGRVVVGMKAVGSQQTIAELIEIIELLPVMTMIDIANVNIVYSDEGAAQWNTTLTLSALVHN